MSTAMQAGLGNGHDAAPRPGNGADSGGDDTPWRQLNEAALANLAAWVPALDLYKCRPARGGYEAVPAWRPSSRGRPLEERDCSLGISPKGIKDFGANVGHTALDLVMLARDCSFGEAFTWLDEQLGWSAGGPTLAFDPETGEIPIDAANRMSVDIQTDPLETWTHPPGLLGEVTDWIVDTARRPNRCCAWRRDRHHRTLISERHASLCRQRRAGGVRQGSSLELCVEAA
jgi:hypothetical protein